MSHPHDPFSPTQPAGWEYEDNWEAPSRSPETGGEAQPWPHQPPPAEPDPLVSPDYAGWWQRSFGLMKAGWRPLLTLQLLALAAGLPVLAAGAAWRAVYDFEHSADAPVGAGFAVASLAGVGGALFAYWMYALAFLASIQVVVRLAAGDPVDLRTALRGARSRILPYVGWQVVAGLVGLAAFCACILPVVYVAAALAVLPAVVTFERGGAIGRCFRLFNADLGVSIARIATVGVLWFAISLVSWLAGIGQGMVALSDGATAGLVVTAAVVAAVVQGLVQVALGVLTSPMLLTTYADMRAAREDVTTGDLILELAEP